MDFKIKPFNAKQLQNEILYINKTYLNDLVNIEQINNEKNKVLLNNLPYLMYVKNEPKLNITLIPENTLNFNGNIDNIIKFISDENELHFLLFKKLNDIAEISVYNFVTSEQGYSIGNYRHNYFEDYNNLLNQDFINSGKTFEKFISGIEFYRLFNSNFNIKRIKRNCIETKLNVIETNSLLKAYHTLDTKFEIIDDNETPILQLLENFEELKKKKTM